jgi:hypothetical protein
MKYFKVTCSMILWVFLFGFHQVHAQENATLFEFGTTYINPTNGDGYFKPLANGLNNALHSGLFPASDFKDEFHFYIGANASMSFISDKHWYFDGMTEDPFTPTTTVEVSTVVGPNEAVVLNSNGGEVYVFPGGFEMNKLLLGIPQISLGGVANTNATIRFLAVPLDEDLGDLSLFGIALQHHISPYFDLENVAITVEGGYHKFKMGDWMDSDFLMFRSTVARAYDKARLYGFLGYQKGKLELVNAEENITTTSTSDNSLLFGVGASAELSIFNFNFECLINSYVCLNLGLGFKF